MRNAWLTVRDGPVIGTAPLREKNDWIIVGGNMLRRETISRRDAFVHNVYDERNRLFASTVFYLMQDGNYEIRQKRGKVYFPRKR